MSEVHGVKETKEALIAMAILGKFVTDKLKDGVQLEDAMALGSALLVDGEFKSKVMAGIHGIEMVPKEVSDLSAADIIEMCQIIPELITIVKG